ncbi:hypothetical protein [Neosynechococcus sphagnicola]|uniref:hypothetical protein n=1 Tax=Neosynechococcus sphagnicola TaxID=1501145 RepID=UPI0019552DD2|nr:hypothetical protein [Neosynechococcus sphagnicola]
MSLPTVSLQAFLEPVPICGQTVTMSQMLEVLRRENCDRVVVVGAQYQPLGLINLHRLMPYLLGDGQKNLSEYHPPVQGRTEERLTASPRGTPHLEVPLTILDLPILETLATLPVHLTVAQYWAHQQQGTTVPGLPWALVDAEGKFLGLLDNLRILKFLTLNLVEPGPEVPMPGLLDRLSTEVTYHFQSPRTVEQLPPQRSGLPAMIRLLEQLPMPLMLQTGMGQVLAQNRSWRQQVGGLLDPIWVQREAASLLGRTTNSPHPILCQSGPDPETCTCICPMQDGHERVWQFIKIPLGLVSALELQPTPSPWDTSQFTAKASMTVGFPTGKSGRTPPPVLSTGNPTAAPGVSVPGQQSNVLSRH